MTTQTEPEVDRLKGLAVEACRKHFDPMEARKWLIGQLMDDRDLLEELIEPLLNEASAWLIYQRRHSDRTAARRDGAAPRGADVIGDARSEAARQSLLDTWLIGGVRLGDMKGGDLLPEAEKERALSNGHGKNAKFYARLAELTPANGKVRRAVSAAHAEKIWKEICQ